MVAEKASGGKTHERVSTEEIHAGQGGVKVVQGGGRQAESEQPGAADRLGDVPEPSGFRMSAQDPSLVSTSPSSRT